MSSSTPLPTTPSRIPLPDSPPEQPYTPRTPPPRPTPSGLSTPTRARSPLHERYDPSALSPPITTPNSTNRRPNNFSYTPYTPTRGGTTRREEEEIQLREVVNSSPFHDSQAWNSPELAGRPSSTPRITRTKSVHRDQVDDLELKIEDDDDPFLSPTKEMHFDDTIDSTREGDFRKGKEGIISALGFELPYLKESVVGEGQEFDEVPKRLGSPFRVAIRNSGTSSFGNINISTSPQDPISTSTPPPRPTFTPPQPSLRLTFSILSTKELLLFVLPCVILSMAVSLVPPYMTTLVGEAFAIFSAYPIDLTQTTPELNKKFQADVSFTALKLTIAGLVSWALNTGVVGAWTIIGEKVVQRLRSRVYENVKEREMGWFDLGMGMKDEDGGNGGGEDSVGAGGLMAKFTQETDDVRLGVGKDLGTVIQNFCTFLACIILALAKSWSLALVTLSSIPLVILNQIVCSALAQPKFTLERRAFAEASTHIERSTGMIATVKAFNAQGIEYERFTKPLERAKKLLLEQAVIWGFSIGGGSFFLLSSYCLGFWYGAKIVREGKTSTGDVMTVFWACLLGGAYMQMFIPGMVLIQRGQSSMASLMTIIMAPTNIPPKAAGVRPDSESTLDGPTEKVIIMAEDGYKVPGSPPSSIAIRNTGPRVSLRRIRPSKAKGEFTLSHVNFAYPSRPDTLALRDVSLFLPSGETTFIVGGSGSGKSTVAQLLLRLYTPDSGEITMDNQNFSYLDMDFTREHIAAVQQGCIMFDLSVHRNVSMGLAGMSQRKPEDATREEVIEACKMANMHDFIRDLPEGYETGLGNKGANLSGGQKQRLAIARARVRDPTILILDEATSALDATSRIVVFEAIKKWRKNRTTIVITHDLSQIQQNDFVYLMKNGSVVEQGFRSDLIMTEGSEFGQMASTQAVQPLPEDNEDRWVAGEDVEELLEGDIEDEAPTTTPDRRSARRSTQLIGRPTSYIAYLDILSDYANRDSFVVPDSTPKLSPGRLSRLQAGDRISLSPRSGRNSVSPTPSKGSPSLGGSPAQAFPASKRASRMSMLMVPGAPGAPNRSSLMLGQQLCSGERPASLLVPEKPRVVSWMDLEQRRKSRVMDIEITSQTPPEKEQPPAPAPVDKKFQSTTRLLMFYTPTLPKKYLFLAGLVCSVGRGVLTPIFSMYIALMMSEVSRGGSDPYGVGILAVKLFAIILGQALCEWGQYAFLHALSAYWAHLMRQISYKLVMKQQQSWFDEKGNTPSRLLHILIKDGEDMRLLFDSIVGGIITVLCMIGLGLGWAMVIGWRLTLVGFAAGPVIILFMAINKATISKMEAKNKYAREELARTFYESVANVRAIRAMALDGIFQSKFDKETGVAYKTGCFAAWALGAGHGATTGIPLFAQGLLIWVSAIYMVKGFYSYSTILQVYNLILFSITFSTGALHFIPAIAKAKMAASDFNRLSTLNTDTEELQGDLRYPITGKITFHDVRFSYPTRSDVPILRGINLQLEPGECVAIVGPSGSGKSTIAALLQRLYEPQSGTIMLDRHQLDRADVRWLRDHIAVVSQSPNLFDGSVTENISYGAGQVQIGDIQKAAKDANVHDFIMTLPDGYETNLGENASLISGGQAQRLQLARALVRRSSIMILDECTSALDPENQKAILETLMKVKQSRTTIFITHKADVMKRCDRVICLSEGKIAEEGPYEDLIKRHGVFAKLMQAGDFE